MTMKVPCLAAVLVLGRVLLGGCEAEQKGANASRSACEDRGHPESLKTLIYRLAISQREATSQPVYTPSRDTPRQDPRVVAYDAAEQLKAYGKLAFPILLESLDDNRQSVCFRRAIPCSVGLACFAIIEDQILPLPEDYVGSFGREGADGQMHNRPLFFEPGPFTRKTVAAWLKAREDKTLTEMQIEGIEWLIAEEKKIGFPAEEEKEKYLYPLERKLAELRAKKAAEAEHRLSAAEAKWLIECWYHKEDRRLEEADKPAIEWGGDEVWRRLHAQVFTVGMQGYLIRGDRVDFLGDSFGGMGLQSVCVSDLDNDGNPELLYIYSWGSGIHRSLVEAWSPAWPEPQTIRAPIAHRDMPDFILDCRSDQNVVVRLAKTLAGKLALRMVDGKPQLELVLDENLPQAIRDEMWITPRGDAEP